MELPKIIKVAGFDITIERMNHAVSMSDQVFGDWTPIEQKIRIDLALSRHKVVDTMIHELLHAIHWAYVIKNEDEEERIVSVTSTALTQVFRDNPDLMKWIQYNLR